MQEKSVNRACDKAIIAYAAGDKNALSIIYDTMARMIFSVAFAITGQYEDAEDVLQETMVAITKYASSYQKGSNAKAWVMAMTRHIAIDTVRRRRPAVCMEQDEIVQLSGSGTDYSRLEVLSLLRILDDDEKQIVLLRLYSRLPYAEIAKIIGISVASAQKKYQRALKKLKNCHENAM